MSTRKTFAVTFGQLHPLKDYWIEVEADNEGEARKALFIILGNRWAFIYPMDTFKPEGYLEGKIGRTIIA